MKMIKDCQLYIDSQKEKFQKLLELIKNNPELRIMPMVDTDCVPSDDWSMWVAEWGEATIDYIATKDKDERLYIKSKDFDDLVDDVYYRKSTATLEEALEEVEKLDWEKVILIQIEPN